LYSSTVIELSRKYQITREQVFFAFVRSLDITFLTGTTSLDHMKLDLEAAESIRLTAEEISSINDLLL
jgi:aryl-alcohol dehydrogenase-like predicted oxidoreductase